MPPSDDAFPPGHAHDASPEPAGDADSGPAHERESRRERGVNTVLAHAGYDPRSYHGFVNPPVVHASTVLFPDYETMRDRTQPYTYGTRGTPTTDALARAIDQLEGSEGTILVPSGLAALSVPFLAFASSGDHVLAVDSLYTPTRIFLDRVLARMGVEVEYFAPDIGEAFRHLMRPNTSVVMLEAPASNSFEMVDVPLVAELAHEARAECVVMMDNTWATPLFFRPLDHGVDVSIHALTKYPSGGSDLVLGSASASGTAWERLHATQIALGTCAAPDDCYLVLRGMRSMNVRLRHHEMSANVLCNWLLGQPAVKRVLYPALPDDPGHTLWSRDFTGASGLFSFVLDGDVAAAARFLNALEIFGLGYSWAGFESLAVIPDFSDRQVAHGPTDGTAIRLQIGLEDPGDLIADLERGFAAARNA